MDLMPDVVGRRALEIGLIDHRPTDCKVMDCNGAFVIRVDEVVDIIRTTTRCTVAQFWFI